MIKFFKYIVPMLGTIGLAYLASNGDLGANVETAAISIAASITPMLAMLVDIVKNGMPGMVVAKLFTKAKKDMNEGDYEIVADLVKKYGVQGGIELVTNLMNKVEEVSNIAPLILAIATVMNQNGAFENISPALKEIVDQSLNVINE